ncbi:MAG TPA: hypothetical protein VE397_06925 [Stellaceae bacterium]|nr:hypothetical protein [Stellaceae bacterium]
MARPGRLGPARDGDGEDRRLYVASLLWPEALPRPVNDNRLWTPAILISLAAGAVLLATAAWGFLS